MNQLLPFRSSEYLKTPSAEVVHFTLKYDRLFIAILSVLCVVSPATAQNESSLFNKCSIGLSAGHYFMDPGLTINVTTPFAIENRLAVRIAGGIRWSEFALAEIGLHARYSNVQLGIVFDFTDHDKIRIYSDAGINVIIPNALVSKQNKVCGFYVAIGSDILVAQKPASGVVYFFELGLNLNRARADKLENMPRYAFGFTPATGLRLQF